MNFKIIAFFRFKLLKVSFHSISLDTSRHNEARSHLKGQQNWGENLLVVFFKVEKGNRENKEKIVGRLKPQ